MHAGVIILWRRWRVNVIFGLVVIIVVAIIIVAIVSGIIMMKVAVTVIRIL
jgi:hypothetical protein